VGEKAGERVLGRGALIVRDGDCLRRGFSEQSETLLIEAAGC